MYQVTLSITNHNQKDLLDRCLTQLRSLGMPKDWRTIVIDNYSIFIDISADNRIVFWKCCC